MPKYTVNDLVAHTAKNGNHYQHCKMCRNKKKKVTRIDEGISPNIIDDNIIEDNIIDDKKSKTHGQSLAGVIDTELRIYKSDMDKCGFDQLFESCVKSYVVHCAKTHGFLNQITILKSQ